MRISGDSPLIDFRIIDETIIIKNKNFDIITNTFTELIKRTFCRTVNLKHIKKSQKFYTKSF